MSQSSDADQPPMFPDLVSAIDCDRDDSRKQFLLQENQLLREQIAHHAQLMQLLTHQLATPLTTLNGSVHLLTEPELSYEHQIEFLTLIDDQIRRMRDLLLNICALQNLETGKIDINPKSFSLQQLIAETMGDFAPYPVVYQFEEKLPDVWGDRWQISQVLTNLISNAIKYSPNGHFIEIGVCMTQSGWQQAWVKDYGLGIPLADQSHLFERFYRVKHVDRQHISGTGLGLSLCKILVENQGGQVGFESIHGAGSRFYFTLPTVEQVDR